MAGRVVLRLAHERLEQTDVLAGLRVPEDTDGEPLRRILDRLDRPVVGVRRLDEPSPSRRNP